MVHLGLVIRLTNTVDAPEAVADNAGELVSIQLVPDDTIDAAGQTFHIQCIRVLHILPTVAVMLSHMFRTELVHRYLAHFMSLTGPVGAVGGEGCDFRAGCIAVQAQLCTPPLHRRRA